MLADLAGAGALVSFGIACRTGDDEVLRLITGLRFLCSTELSSAKDGQPMLTLPSSSTALYAIGMLMRNIHCSVDHGKTVCIYNTAIHDVARA